MTATDDRKSVTTVEVDLDSIPEYVQTNIAAAGLAAFLNFLKQPGSRELLEARKAELKAAGRCGL